MYNQMCLLVFSCVYNELQLCCCLVAALFNVRGSSRRLSRLCQLQRFVVEVWRKKCHMLSPTSSSSSSHSSSPRSNLDKRFSEFLHLIELTAQWEASPSRHPRLTATAEGEVGTSLSALLPKRHICFFPMGSRWRRQRSISSNGENSDRQRDILVATATNRTAIPGLGNISK